MITVLLVEDHASYRQALRAFMHMQDDLRVVAEAERADEAGAAAARTCPTLALVDLDMPGGSGVDAIVDIRGESPPTRCIVLSALTDDVELGRGIEAGASAVLHKAMDITDLVGILRAVADGATVLPAEETSRRLRALAGSRNRGWQVRALDQTITRREREVLRGLAQGAGNRSIGRELGISPDTVQTHIRNLLAKLGVGSRLEAVVKALRLGLIAPPQ
ncbi:response regulator transcription factor [soil metagenome]